MHSGSDTVVFGLIGCGTIAEVHLSALAGLSGARIAGVTSRSAERAQNTAQRFSCRAYADHAALLADPAIDAVIITTPSGSHAELALAALTAGKHVVVEKPMAMNLADARAVTALARARGLVLSVVFQRRFESHHQAARAAIATGKLGRVLLAEAACPYYRDQAYYDSAPWRGTLAEDGGALMNQAIHSVDLLLWLCGDATSVMALTATQAHRMEAEDLALAIVQLDTGGVGSLMASTSIRPGFAPTLNVYGEHGSIKLAGPDAVAWHVPGVAAPRAPASSAVAVATHRLASDAHHAAQLQDVIEAIRSGSDPLVTGEEGQRSLALIDAIYRSARSRHTEPVERA